MLFVWWLLGCVMISLAVVRVRNWFSPSQRIIRIFEFETGRRWESEGAPSDLKVWVLHNKSAHRMTWKEYCGLRQGPASMQPRAAIFEIVFKGVKRDEYWLVSPNWLGDIYLRARVDETEAAAMVRNRLGSSQNLVAEGVNGMATHALLAKALDFAIRWHSAEAYRLWHTRKLVIDNIRAGANLADIRGFLSEGNSAYDNTDTPTIEEVAEARRARMAASGKEEAEV